LCADLELFADVGTLKVNVRTEKACVETVKVNVRMEKACVGTVKVCTRTVKVCTGTVKVAVGTEKVYLGTVKAGPTVICGFNTIRSVCAKDLNRFDRGSQITR
jgi:hypothetical protein